MATEAQVVANRSNAQKSTGPRTAEGKAVVAQNAVRHGLLAQQAVIKGEDPGEFEFYRDQMLAELAPAGAMESMLAERVVGLAWRLRRAERIQAEVFDALLTKEAPSPLQKLIRSQMPKWADGTDETELSLGRVVAKDFGNSRVLDRLGLYERRIEHSLYRTMAELQKLRLLRELDPPAEKPVPQPAEPPGAERLRQTKPIDAPGSAVCPPGQAEECLTAPLRTAKQSQSAGPVSGETAGFRRDSGGSSCQRRRVFVSLGRDWPASDRVIGGGAAPNGMTRTEIHG